MFYLTDPAETSFPDMASLPTSYTAQATPFFAGMIVLEWAILLLRGEKLRLSDGLFSVAHGLIMTLMEYVLVLFYYLNHFLRALLSGLLFSSYIYIHQTFCIYALPWDYTATWVCAAIGIDFCYYWVHRAAHGKTGKHLFQIYEYCCFRNKPAMGSSPSPPLIRRIQPDHCTQAVSFSNIWVLGICYCTLIICQHVYS